jgi:pilus assembly protein Flp/PilA
VQFPSRQRRIAHFALRIEGDAVLTDLKLSLLEFLKEEDGPTAIEYAVMLALIITVCYAAISLVGGAANQSFTAMGNSLTTSS